MRFEILLLALLLTASVVVQAMPQVDFWFGRINGPREFTIGSGGSVSKQSSGTAGRGRADSNNKRRRTYRRKVCVRFSYTVYGNRWCSRLGWV